MNEKDLLFSKDHVWVKKEKNTVVLGLSGFAQELIGKIQNIEFTKNLSAVKKNSVIAVIEGQKSIFDILSPIAGEVVETNRDLTSNPDALNSDPYGAGWFIKVEPGDPLDLNTLLSQEDYLSFTEDK
ncbi:MAG: glycine cleavage system protein GcvH [Spirochaetales bacterium]|nr:glycine cleavage system protein GcvH [Spirochaetales bacterium]